MMLENPEEEEVMDLSCELEGAQEERDEVITTR